MKRLTIATAAIWVGAILMQSVAPAAFDRVLSFVALSGPTTLGRWRLWQVATYALVEEPARLSILWTVLGFWWLGSPVERSLGHRRALELVVLGNVGGALVALVAWRVAPVHFQGFALGMRGAISALLVGLGFVYAEQPLSFFGIGPMKGKHLVLGLAALTFLQAAYSGSASGATSVGGLLAGGAWMWAVTRPRSGKRKAKQKAHSRRRSGAHLRAVRNDRDDESDEKKIWN